MKSICVIHRPDAFIVGNPDEMAADYSFKGYYIHTFVGGAKGVIKLKNKTVHSLPIVPFDKETYAERTRLRKLSFLEYSIYFVLVIFQGFRLRSQGELKCVIVNDSVGAAAGLVFTALSQIVPVYRYHTKYSDKGNWITRKTQYIIESLIYRRGVVLCVGEAQYQEAINRSARKAVLAPWWPKDFLRDFLAADGNHVRRKFGRPFLLYVGGLRPEKGVEYLIRAFSIVKKARSTMALVLIGDGVLREELKELSGHLGIADDVFFLGHKERGVVPSYMAAASALVLPSVSDARPKVVIEASLAGTPVVSTKVGGIKDLVQDGKTGILVSARNIDELAKAILQVLSWRSFDKGYARSFAKGYVETHEEKPLFEYVRKFIEP